MNLLYKATLISQYVQEWLHINDLDFARPADVASYLKDKGLYRGKNPEYQLTRDLAKLSNRKKLELIKGVEKVTINVYSKWMFKRVK